MADKGGRPMSYSTPEKLQEAILTYFDGTTRPTLAGLALALNIDRQTLYNYAAKDMFFDTIKKARETVEAKYEERLVWDNAPTGTIFALKNMGWKDKTENEVYGKDGGPLINIIMPLGE
jgi:hypothetical protein